MEVHIYRITHFIPKRLLATTKVIILYCDNPQVISNVKYIVNIVKEIREHNFEFQIVPPIAMGKNFEWN